MKDSSGKIGAVVEVLVVFSATMLLMGGIIVSPLERAEISLWGRPFLVNAVEAAVPLAVLLLTRRRLADYGLVVRPLGYHLKVVGTCAIPVALAGTSSMFFDPRRWDGALPLTGVSLALLFCLAWLLRDKPDPVRAIGTGSMLALLPATQLARDLPVGKALSAFVFFLFFVGPAEEILFRGYIQSRLNQAFGKPFRFLGVTWGWGLLGASALFGLMHVLNLGGLNHAGWQLQPAYGVWTFVGGCVFGLVREKTGSVLAPAILHGFPQAISYPFLGL
jgi:membrane protease YdiL (CAAX protease family)